MSFLSKPTTRRVFLAANVGAALAVAIPDSLRASISGGGDLKINAAISFPRSTADMEPWIVDGVNARDRSPVFLNRLEQAGSAGDAFAQYFLGLLMLLGDGIPQNAQEAMRLIRQSAERGFLPAMTALGVIFSSGEYAKRDPTQALPWLRKAAQAGDPEAQFQLGALFERGFGMEIDMAQSAHWMRLAAEQSHPQAMNALGCFYMRGSGVPQDSQIAEQWLNKSLEAGYQRAKFNLGLLYLDNEKKESQGLRLIKESADAGDERAFMQLATMAYHGLKGVPQSNSDYLEGLRKASEAGLPQAQYQLAQELSFGTVVKHDPVEARKWASAAADGDVSDARVMLAGMLANGDGGNVDLDGSLHLLRLAATQGNATAQYRLGLALSDGVIAPKDIEEGRRLIEQAARQNMPDACFSLAVMMEQGVGGKQDHECSRAYMKKAAEFGMPEAEHTVAAYYSEGVPGFPQDSNKAVEWLRRAADHGAVNAQYDLGMLLLEGKFAPQDKATAMWLFRQAAENGHGLAQNNIGYACYTGEAGYTDLVEAFVWLSLAVEKSKEPASTNLAKILPLLMSNEVSEAKRLLENYRAWVP